MRKSLIRILLVLLAVTSSAAVQGCVQVGDEGQGDEAPIINVDTD